MARPTHLARRFFGSLRPGGPSRADQQWVGEVLLPAEQSLWKRMSGPDQRHAVGVARRVASDLGSRATRPVLAAALLHDVGKVDARLGTYGRVVATLSAAVAGHGAAYQWSEGKGFVRRVGLYLRHPELGADMLALAGSDPLTVTWAREHHDPPERWSLDPTVAEALARADDD